MNDEAAFLEAIRATPHDPALRLIFADWLDERDDPRAELVRIEEEMRQVPVFGDRFWQLKPRRNELRRRAPWDWLAELDYGYGSFPVFRHGIPDGWKERWRLIREYTEQWHRIPLGDIGGRADEIRAVEQRLGRTLPPSVREWVAYAFDVRRETDFHDVLRDVYRMEDLQGLSAVCLIVLGEGDYGWAVRHADLLLPDPPVYAFHSRSDNETDATFVSDMRNPVATSVTSFALEYAFGYARGLGGDFSTDVADPVQVIRGLELAFPIWSQFESAAIFEAPNILVRLGASFWTPDTQLIVNLARRMSREAVPACLWDYTRNGGSFHGMFRPEPPRA